MHTNPRDVDVIPLVHQRENVGRLSGVTPRSAYLKKYMQQSNALHCKRLTSDSHLRKATLKAIANQHFGKWFHAFEYQRIDANKLKSKQEKHIYRHRYKNPNNEAIPASRPSGMCFHFAQISVYTIRWLVMAKIIAKDGWPALPDVRHCPALPYIM